MQRLLESLIASGLIYRCNFVIIEIKTGYNKRSRAMILTQFDPAPVAVINPSDFINKVEGMPKVAIACYSCVTFDRMIQDLDTEIVSELSSANGIVNVYKGKYKGIELAFFMMGVGAPMSAACMEEIYEMGVEKIIVFGTCGVLDRDIEDCSIIIPNAAIRDEGTSYHYAPLSDEIEVNEKHIDTFTKMLDDMGISYTIGKTWTTDAIYRETEDKVKARKEQGCICVDMECSADAAVAKFRDKDLIQFFYAADNLDNEDYDKRSLSNEDKVEEKDKIAVIALELAIRI